MDIWSSFLGGNISHLPNELPRFFRLPIYVEKIARNSIQLSKSGNGLICMYKGYIHEKLCAESNMDIERKKADKAGKICSISFYGYCTLNGRTGNT
jgi:hypothetical protein